MRWTQLILGTDRGTATRAGVINFSYATGVFPSAIILGALWCQQGEFCKYLTKITSTGIIVGCLLFATIGLGVP